MSADPQAQAEQRRRRLVKGEMTEDEAEAHLAAIERESVELADREIELRVTRALAAAVVPERACERCGGKGVVFVGVDRDFDSGMLEAEDEEPCPACVVPERGQDERRWYLVPIVGPDGQDGQPTWRVRGPAPADSPSREIPVVADVSSPAYFPPGAARVVPARPLDKDSGEPYAAAAEASSVGSQSTGGDTRCDDRGEDAQAAEGSATGTTRRGSAMDAATSGGPTTTPAASRPLPKPPYDAERIGRDVRREMARQHTEADLRQIVGELHRELERACPALPARPLDDTETEAKAEAIDALAALVRECESQEDVDRLLLAASGHDRDLAQDEVIERVRAALRPLGYAVGVHGSRKRDLDLMAVPWIEDCERDPAKIRDALEDVSLIEAVGQGGVASPHNRLGFALHGVPGAAKVQYVDLSLILPAASPHGLDDTERPTVGSLQAVIAPIIAGHYWPGHDQDDPEDEAVSQAWEVAEEAAKAVLAARAHVGQEGR